MSPSRRTALRALAASPLVGLPWRAASTRLAAPRWLAAPMGLAGATARAEAGGALAQLQAFVSETRAARGVFLQRTLRQSGQPAESGSGTFAFSRPGRFRWEVRRPFEQLMVADGEKLYFYDRDLNQVTVRKLADSLGASPAAILFGSNELERSFVLKESGTRDGLEWLDAVPRSKDAGFERIQIGFRAGLPEAMEVRDAFGRTTVFAFSGIERNPRFDADTFRFVPPKGADLIQQ